MSQYLSEAFKSLDSLNEDVFSVDENGLQDLVKFEEEDEDTNIIDIIDTEAETHDDLEDSYEGKIILDCSICHSKQYKNIEDIVIEGDLANIGEECPFCYTNDGFKVIGQVAPFNKEEAETEEEEKPEETKTDKEDTELKEAVGTLERPMSKITGTLGNVLTAHADELAQVYDAQSAITLLDKLEPEISQKDYLKKVKLDIMRAPRKAVNYLYNIILKGDGMGRDLEEGIFGLSKKKKPNYFIKEDIWTTTFAKDPYKRVHMNVPNIGEVVVKRVDGDLVALHNHKQIYSKEFDWFLDDNSQLKDLYLKLSELDFNKNESINKFKSIKENYSTFTKKEFKNKLLDILRNSPKDEYDRNMSFYVGGITIKPTKDNSAYIITLLPDKDPHGNYRYAPMSDISNYVIDELTKQNIDCKFRQVGGSGRFTFSIPFELINESTPFNESKYINEGMNWTNGEEEYEIDSTLASAPINSIIFIKKSYGGKNRTLKFEKVSTDKWDSLNNFNDRTGSYESDKSLKDKYIDGATWKLEKAVNESKSIKESVNNVNVETDEDVINVTTDDNGKVTVTTEPKTSEIGPGEEIIAPIKPEVQNEIKDNVANGDEIEIDVDEFDEESFDELGESYLKKIYENVDTYKTSQVSLDNNTLKVEGVIKFKSGNSKKTSFLFEARTATKTGIVKFIGENTQITKGKKAFTITGNINNKKFLSESLTYNYGAKTPEGKTKRLYGTIKK